jgi:hypothetical protein
MKSLQLPIYSLTTALALSGALTAPASDYYSSVVINDHPLAYYRLNDVPPPDVATNSGSLGAAGNGWYLGAGHRALGALAADPNAAASFDGSGAQIAVPFTPALNPPASQSFTVEAWVLPTIEGQPNAQSPLFNLHAPAGENSQGWVFFQQASSATTGANGSGFEFQMYNANGSTPSIDITGGSYTIGQWTHLVAVWNGHAATLYVNDVNVGSQTNTYVSNPDAPFTLGAFGTNNLGDNPFTGSIDEVAFYATALTAAQIGKHYTNALSASPGTAYSSLILADGAIEYLRLNEASPLYNVAVNSGRIGAAGDGIHSPGAVHGVAGAIVGSTDTAMHYSAMDTNTDDGGVPTTIPFTNSLNPNGSFTVEAWLRPTEIGNGNAQSPFFNRDPNENVKNRYGWDFYQRAPGTGWDFRMFNGKGSDRVYDITGGSYTIGKWCHLVAVYNASVPSATLYLNGLRVGFQSGLGTDGLPFNPNTGSPLGIGGYSDGRQNPFVGDIDEFALYTNALTATQVLNHFQNGTNANRTLAYDKLILQDGAAEYLRLDEPARAIVTNSGTLGSALNATYVNTTNTLIGPQAPVNLGFDSNNLAAYFNSTNSYLEMGDPVALNFDGPLTLEAWILPGLNQNPNAYVISHGENDDFSGAVTLGIINGSYAVGAINGSVGSYASAYIPYGDLGGGSWIHLAGTWDGTNWNLFRNGVLLATYADTAGPAVVTNANWAIGARGKWKYAAGFPFSGEQSVFSGGIDEAAIYPAALSPSQIAAHYAAGTAGNSPLTMSLSGANLILNWASGTLQQAADATGPYTDVDSANSPYSVPINGANQMFYRLRF